MDKTAMYQDVLTFWKWFKNCEEYPANDANREAELACKVFESASHLYNGGSSFLRKLIMVGIDELESDCAYRRIQESSKILKDKSKGE